MMPLPDWTRLRPYPLPRATVPSRGGCGAFSGCTLGCGGTLAVLVLALEAWKTFGVLAGLGCLVALVLIAAGLARRSKLLAGVLLGAVAAVGVWHLMSRDYFKRPGQMLAYSCAALCLFSLAGYLEGIPRP